MKTNLTISYELTESAVENILANGLADSCGFDDVDFDKEEYKLAKKALLEEGVKEATLTIESVEARMLFMGYKIRLHMAEERPNEEWYDLTLEKLGEGLRKYSKDPINGTMEDFLNEDPECRLDFYDYDALLQYACYGKVLIG